MKNFLFCIWFGLAVSPHSFSQYWSAVGVNSMDNPVSALYMDATANVLYIGGDFVSPVSYITKWDGTSFTSAGTGTNGLVYAITKFNGSIIAGGSFSTAGGSPANNIAAWNGTSWTALGTGTNGTIYALSVFNGELYAGGTFTTAGGVTVSNIAKWNGTAWAAVGTGVSGGSVDALAAYGGHLYVGGQFTSPNNYLARWDGAAWSLAGGSAPDNFVHALHVWNGNLYAGGRFGNIGSPFSRIAKWDGANWSALGAGVSGGGSNRVMAITDFNGALYAGGRFNNPGSNMGKWDGLSWTALGSGTTNDVYAVSGYKGKVFAGGLFGNAGGQTALYLAQWDEVPPPPVYFQRTYSGSGTTQGNDIVSTPDWGYASVGYGTFGLGGNDCYLMRADSAGKIMWTKSFGGSANEQLMSGMQTSDGGYIVAGFTQSFGAGSNDAYIIRTDAQGGTVWRRTFGGTGSDMAWAVQQTKDGGYAAAGYTYSYGSGTSDFYLLKLFGTGDTTWTRVYGTASIDQGTDMKQLNDGGYILTGYTNSGSTDYNVALLRTSSSGALLWNYSLGGTLSDYGDEVIVASDGGFVVVGRSGTASANSNRIMLLKTTSSGSVAWTKWYDGPNDEYGHSVVQTSDGGYAITGYSTSPGIGSYDMYLLRVDSNGGLLWTKRYGGTGNEQGSAVIQTYDGGFGLLGHTYNFPQPGVVASSYFVKTDAAGISGNCHEISSTYSVTSPVFTATALTIITKTGGTIGVSSMPGGNPVLNEDDLTLSSSVTQVNVSCYGGSNAQASILPINGITPYTYLWSNNQTTGSISGLPAASYSVTVYDQTGCAITQTILITQPTLLTTSITAQQNSACYGLNNGLATVSANGGTLPYTYLWNTTPAQSSASVTNLSPGSYTATVTDNKNCLSATAVNIALSTPTVSICLVTVDSVTYDKNMIVWEKPVTGAIDSFRVYRNVSNVMTLIGSQSYSVTSMFVDATAGVNPKVQAHEYAISAVDTCGNESALSPTHITIHQLTPLFSPPKTYDLVWSDYQGFLFNDYDIWRDSTDKDKWEKIGSVPVSLSTTFTDLNAPSDSVRYRIEAAPLQPCMATIKNPDPMATSVKSSKSNTQEKIIGPTSVINNTNSVVIDISPNPNFGAFSLFCTTAELTKVRIFNLMGEIIFEENTSGQYDEISIPDAPSGMYHLQVLTTGGIINVKMLVQ